MRRVPNFLRGFFHYAKVSKTQKSLQFFWNSKQGKWNVGIWIEGRRQHSDPSNVRYCWENPLIYKDQHLSRRIEEHLLNLSSCIFCLHHHLISLLSRGAEKRSCCLFLSECYRFLLYCKLRGIMAKKKSSFFVRGWKCPSCAANWAAGGSMLVEKENGSE